MSRPDRDADTLHDEGAQAERTALSWQRTGLSLLGAGIVVLHAGDELDTPLRLVPALLLLATGALVTGVGAPVRYRETLRDLRSGRSPVRMPLLLALSLVVTVSALAAVGIVVVHAV